MKRLLLYSDHERAGAVFGTLEGWEIPFHYGDKTREYFAAKESCAISDLSYRGKLKVTGQDRTAFLHNMLTNDIKALSPGKGCYAALLTDRAKMVSDMFVFALEDYYLLDIEAGAPEKAKQFIEKYIVADDVIIKDITSETGHLHVQGPRAISMLQEISGSSHMGSPANFIQVCRWGPGIDILCAEQGLRPIWENILGKGIQPIGFEAQEAMRIEAGVPRFGVDMDETVLILEAGLTHAISFTKGCFLGQEIVARVRAHGRITRKLVSLALPGTEPVKKGEKIKKDSEEIGEITSSAFSPSFGKVFALGYVKTEWAEPGTTLSAGGREAIVFQPTTS